MVYGDLEPRVVRHIARGLTGVDPDDCPRVVVIGPYRFRSLLGRGVLHWAVRSSGLKIKEVKTYHTPAGRSWLVTGGGECRALFLMSHMGAVFAADTSVLLSKIDRVDEVIFLGSAACLQEQMRTRDYNLPTKCLRTERILDGEYPRRLKAEADRDLRNSLAERLLPYAEAAGSKILDGLHATVPYVLMETTEFLQGLRARGVHTLDMELGVHYTILNAAGKKVAGMLMGGDRPLEGVLMGEERGELRREMGKCLARGVLDHLVGAC
jgi:purine-nucleoside phosphorylase